MNNFNIIFLIATCFTIVVQSRDCISVKERAIRKCASLTSTNQEACIEKRMKRSSCYTICESCDCERCSENQCECSSCCPTTTPSCTTKYCCYRTCYKGCDSVGCRRDCRTNCTQSLAKSNVEATTTETVANLVAPQNNVTTIINIHTQVNNTRMVENPVYRNITNTYSVIPQNIVKKVKCCEILVQRCEPTFHPYFRIQCRYEKEYDCGDICLKQTKQTIKEEQTIEEEQTIKEEQSIDEEQTMKGEQGTIEEAGGVFNTTETVTQIEIEPEFDLFPIGSPDVTFSQNTTHGDVKNNYPNHIPDLYPYQQPIYQYQSPCIPYWPYFCHSPVIQRPKLNQTTQKIKENPCSFQPYFPYTNCNRRVSDCTNCYMVSQCPMVCQNYQMNYPYPPMMPFGYPIPPCLSFGCNPYFGYGYPIPYFPYPQLSYGPIWGQMFRANVPGGKSNTFDKATGTDSKN